MVKIMLSVALGILAPVEASEPAVRVNPPLVNPWDLVPPGTHCLELLPYAIQAGIQPEDAQWYLNVAYGETLCWHPDWRRPNMILPGGTWGATQIAVRTWSRTCGGVTGPDLLDETAAFRCTLAVEAAAGRRQWRPHNETTGLFPGQS